MSDLSRYSDPEFQAVMKDRMSALREAVGTPHYEFALDRYMASFPEQERRILELKEIIARLDGARS